jgi:hypothetical protein
MLSQLKCCSCSHGFSCAMCHCLLSGCRCSPLGWCAWLNRFTAARGCSLFLAEGPRHPALLCGLFLQWLSTHGKAAPALPWCARLSQALFSFRSFWLSWLCFLLLHSYAAATKLLALSVLSSLYLVCAPLGAWQPLRCCAGCWAWSGPLSG